MIKLLLFTIIGIIYTSSPLYAHTEMTGPTPSMGTCGTTPSISGNDSVGTITVGSGVVTACTMNFAQGWTAAPVCNVSTDAASISAGITSVSTAAMTVGLSATLGSGHIYYRCSRAQ